MFDRGIASGLDISKPYAVVELKILHSKKPITVSRNKIVLLIVTSLAMTTSSLVATNKTLVVWLTMYVPNSAQNIVSILIAETLIKINRDFCASDPTGG